MSDFKNKYQEVRRQRTRIYEIGNTIQNDSSCIRLVHDITKTCKTLFYYIKLGFEGVFISRTCFPDELPDVPS